MIGGDGINDESNKMSPAPDTQIYLTKDTGFSPNAELANRMLVKAAEGFFGRMKVEACVCSIEVRPMRHNFPVRKSGRN